MSTGRTNSRLSKRLIEIFISKDLLNIACSDQGILMQALPILLSL